MKAPVEWGAVHRVRLGHVGKLLLDRYGPELPDDDAGDDDLFILLNIKAMACKPERREKALLNEIGLRAPWLPADKAQKLATRISDKPLKFTSETLGQRLNLDNATRERLRIWQIRPVDLDDEGLKQRRRQRRQQQDRERKLRKRQLQNRTEWLKANSKQRTKPWLEMGISRASYYRRQAKSRETRCSAKPVKKSETGLSAKVPRANHADRPVSQGEISVGKEAEEEIPLTAQATRVKRTDQSHGVQ
jgi:hypothetical protein